MPRPPLLAIAVLVLGCGHPATPQECAEIADRFVEVEVRAQNVTDPAAVDARKREFRAGRKEELDRLQRQCIGRRVTDAAMACVRRAATADEITEKCLR